MSATSATGAGPVQIVEVPLGDRRVREIVRFAWRHYRGDPCWTPPLDADLLGNRLLGLRGLLTPAHPYHADAQVTHFLALRGSEVVGTVSAAVNRRFNDFHHVKVGFFGFFETVDDDAVAHALLDAARSWLAAKGMTVMRGPGMYGNATHERQGLLIEGFEYPPTVELTHNPQYYAGILERYGLVKAKDYVAYRVFMAEVPWDRLDRAAARVAARGRIETRQADLGRLEEELRLVVRLYNEAWSRNWGYVPQTNAEADALAASLEPIIDPGLVRFAYHDGEPVAVLGALPDPNWALRPRWRWYGDSDVVRLARLLATRSRIPRVRLMFFGVLEPFRNVGVDAVLFSQIGRYALTRGYTEVEASMLLEDNDAVLRASAGMGAREYKRWRIYDMDIASDS